MDKEKPADLPRGGMPTAWRFCGEKTNVAFANDATRFRDSRITHGNYSVFRRRAPPWPSLRNLHYPKGVAMPLQSFLKTMGEKVSKARKQRKLTQRDVASLAKIPYRYFQRIEAGRVNMTLSTLLRLSLPLDVHPCELMPNLGEWENHPYKKSGP